MKYVKNIAMLMTAFFALLSVSCTDDETEPSGASRLFRPVSVTLTPRGTSLTASWSGMKGAIGYWVELYERIERDNSSVGGSASETEPDYSLVASNEQVTGTEWVVNGLKFDQTYYFRIKAVDADASRNSYFTDFQSVRIPAMTEVLSCEVLDPVEALVKFAWMPGYDVSFVKITAPDGGVRTINVDDADGGFTMDGFLSGTYTVVAGNERETYNTVEFIIPVLYDIDPAKVTFDNVTFLWRVDAKLAQLICTNVADAEDKVVFDLTEEQRIAGELVADASMFKPNTTYVVVMAYEAEAGAEPELTNTASFTAMMVKPEGVVFVETIDELLAAINGSATIIALQPGEYVVPNKGSITILRALTLMSATRQQPKVIVNQFTLANTAYIDGTLRFEGIEFECANLNNTTSCFIDHTGQKANIKRIEVEDCYVHDFGSSFMRFNRQETSVEEVYVNNNRLLRMYGQNSYLQISKIVAREVTFTNNTATGLDFQKAGVRFLSYMADDNTVVKFSNNTILFNNSTGRLFFHLAGLGAGANTAGSITISDNIFYNEDSDAPRNVSNFDSFTVTANIENNVVATPWGAGSDGGSIPTETLASWGNKYAQLDPAFKSVSGYDFTVTNDEVRKLGVGDPRWLK
ncbi:MAG: fibronectin type III domain-containing protein [Alistipes sp.]|nr:fibronectin type III domain-containing protein [Alistipes sp.]